MDRRIRGIASIARRYEAVITSGPLGIDGRLPSSFVKQEDANNTQVAITDPYILYQNYVTQGVLEKDEMQLRAMKELQKLYHRVVDYRPPEELNIRMSLLLRKIELKHAESALKSTQKKISPFRLNAIPRMFKRDPEMEKRQLVKFITDEEELSNIASPQGLLINGEVGCGKSLLMDLFASTLPHHSKMRWHYNNFILWVYSELHKLQQERIVTSNLDLSSRKGTFKMENEFALFEIAQKMINRNTILMLDEFMLPDIASANIIKILFTYFFKLGGVLVATSNKLPEELYSNAFNRTKFRDFVGILNTRCHSIDMRSTKDYRALFAHEALENANIVVKSKNKNHKETWDHLIKQQALGYSDSEASNKSIADLGFPTSLSVYNRTTHIPVAFNNRKCYLTFDYICRGLYSSSDYITLASQFETIILDDVPLMTVKMKNEARRFITLLDAIYEARCQFYMRSDVDVDELFFPDASETRSTEVQKILDATNDETDYLDVQDEEMYAKTAMDISNPYRPNVSSYDTTSGYEDFGKNRSHDEDTSSAPAVDFSKTKAFTGEDEKFAYKRAVSRIKEMTGSESWRKSSRWVPVDQSMRPWESNSHSIFANVHLLRDNPKADAMVNNHLRDVNDDAKHALKDTNAREISRREGIPFHQLNKKLAPSFTNLDHFWAMGSWTSKQGKRLRDSIARTWLRTSARENDGKD